MNITFYELTENADKISKTLSGGITKTINLKRDFDIINGVLYLSFNPLDMTIENENKKFNYCYITELKRYYFINRVDFIRFGFYRVILSIDVLKTYETEIKALTPIIIQSENPQDNKIDCVMSSETTETVYNLTDVFDSNGKLYLSTVFTSLTSGV